MRVPKTVRVAGYDITVKYKQDLKLQGDDCWGTYDPHANTICLRKGMEKNRKAEIILHECIHAIDSIHLLGLSEKAVRVLAIELIALVKNNKVKL